MAYNAGAMPVKLLYQGLLRKSAVCITVALAGATQPCSSQCCMQLLIIVPVVQAGIQNAATASAAIGLVNVVGTVIAGSLIEKAGRVQLLTVSFTGMCISMFAMVAGRSLPQLASSAGTIAFAGTVAYVLSFALGAGPVPGLLVPEINTEQMRGKLQSAPSKPTALTCLHSTSMVLSPPTLSCTSRQNQTISSSKYSSAMYGS